MMKARPTVTGGSGDVAVPVDAAERVHLDEGAQAAAQDRGVTSAGQKPITRLTEYAK